MMNISYNKVKIINKITMFLWALYPILGWYSSFTSFSLGMLILLLLSLSAICNGKVNNTVFPFIFYIVWFYVALNYYGYASLSDIKSYLPGGFPFCIFVFSLIGGIVYYNQEYLKKYMSWLVKLSIFLFWVQILLSIEGTRVCFVPNIGLDFLYEDMSYAQIKARHLIGMPCSFFLEKSYMAYYLCTYLCFELFDERGKKVIMTKFSMIIILTLLMLRSGSGMLGMAVIIIAKILTYLNCMSSAKKIVYFFLCTCFFVGSIWVYIQTESGSEILGRTEELTTEGTSGFTRVAAGYFMYANMPLENQIFGMDRATFLNTDTTFYHDETLYLNGVQNILITLGIVGLVLYILFYSFLFSKGSVVSRVAILVFLLFSLLEFTYLTIYMAMFTVISCGELYYRKSGRLLN